MTELSRRIAAVDDDPSVLKALARLIRTRSLHVQTYGSAERFLAALPDGMPACLIVDLHMPEMSGLELQEHLQRSGLSIPTIVITAHDEPDARARCLAAGAMAFLLKPLQDTALFAAIDDAFRLRRPER